MSDVISGFVDLQVNGYAGVDFNSDELTEAQLVQACQALEKDGVAAVLATIMTEHLPTMCARLARLVCLRERHASVRQLIAGFHIEGPFILPEPGYRGAHPADAVRPADCDAAARLLEAGAGLVRLFTLAPECDPQLAVTRLLRRAGVVVAAGHCNPNLDQLDAALDAGLSHFTHLGNGCPMTLARHDNIVQRALSRSDRLTLCFIADGVHLPSFALRNYLRTAGLERCCVVSDAMAAAGLGPGRHRLSRWEVTVGPDKAARSPDGSHLLGSVATMPEVALVLQEQVGLTSEQCRTLLVDNPRRVISAQKRD